MLIRGMTYSIDLRQRVVDYVERGGSKAAATRVFNVSRGSIYNWFGRESLIPTKVIRRNGKLDWKRLREDVIKHPDRLLRERAAIFGVRINAIWYAMKSMNIRYKKNTSLQRKKPSGKVSISATAKTVH